MKTSTKVRIGLCIVLSIFLLALIGRKTRETFEAEGKIQDGFIENSEVAREQFGYKINPSSHPDYIAVPSKQNAECALATKNHTEREQLIESEATEAKQQLTDFLQKKSAEIKKKREAANLVNKTDIYGTHCNFFKFPGLL